MRHESPHSAAPRPATSGSAGPRPGRRRAPALGLACLLSWGLPWGCTDPGQRVDRDIQDLRNQIAELRRARSDHGGRIEELQSRVFILEDRMETARLAAMRQGRTPELPVVALSPERDGTGGGAAALPAGGGGARTAAPEAEEVPVLRVGPTDDSPIGGAPPRTLPADTLAKADRRGIQADTRLAVAAVPPPPSHPSEAGATSEAPPASSRRRGAGLKAAEGGDSDGAATAYEGAYDAMQAGNLDAALAAFRGFGARYPKHDLSDNAQYWVGECLYARKQFKEALAEFRRVIDDHPDGNKVPDSLLKIGLSYQSLGDGLTAKDVLGQVVAIFPDSPAAKVARERLERL